MSEMPVRIMEFELDPEEVKASIGTLSQGLGLSMTLPYLEPYLIRTMRVALEFATDERIKRDVRQFIGQEAQHFRQHRKLNDILRATYPEYAGLKKIEDDMEADYQRYTKTMSLRFNLAYAEGFEAATCALARQGLDAPQPSDSGMQRLFKWHATEEVEHRTVTFDIYHHLYGGYFYRLIGGMYGQYHFFKYVFRFAKFIRENCPDKDLVDQQPVKTAEQKKMERTALLKLLGNVLKTYLPWYNPSKLEIPGVHAMMSEQYSNEALETRTEA